MPRPPNDRPLCRGVGRARTSWRTLSMMRGGASTRSADRFYAPCAQVFSHPVTVDMPFISTPGADRCTTLANAALATTVFRGGHKC